MKRSAFGNQCPACLNSFRHRIRRKFWIRNIPESRRPFCDLGGCTTASLFRKTSRKEFNRLPYRKPKALVGAHN